MEKHITGHYILTLTTGHRMIKDVNGNPAENLMILEDSGKIYGKPHHSAPEYKKECRSTSQS